MKLKNNDDQVTREEQNSKILGLSVGINNPHSIHVIYKQINKLKYEERSFVIATRLSKGLFILNNV